MAAEINNFVGEDFLQYMYVLDSTYTKKLIIDTFSDFFWIERYCGYGEFEITIPVNQEIIDTCHVDDYVMIEESSTIMIIDTIGLHTDVVNGDTLTISGRSLDSILDRRIIIDESIGEISEEGESIKIGVQEAIKTILTNNVISPKASNRRISSFRFNASTDSKITRATMETFQAQGDLVYDKILEICQNEGFGFKVDPYGNGGYQFELYNGTDRSRKQTKTIPVIFSDSYENLPSSNYLTTMKSYKNAVYVAWEWKWEREWEEITGYKPDFVAMTIEPVITQMREGDEGMDVTEVTRGDDPKGLSRRELFIKDNHGVHDLGESPDAKGGVESQMIDLGKESLADSTYKTTTYFEGDTEPNRQFIYGVDYFVGDIVQLENKYGLSGRCRITEIVMSRDGSGVSMCPTFEIIEGDD